MRTIVPPHKGFKSDLSKLQALIDERNKLFGQEWGIIMGTNDMTIDEHINALREAGADVLRDEIQRQLNEWLEERDQ